MERRSGNYLHYIQVVRRGLIVKVRNVDSHGKPDLTIKKLKDIYDTENARLGGSHVKCESECFPVVARTLKAIEPENNKFGCLADDEVNSQSADYNSGEITLKQLKERCKSKKRKFATPSPTSTSPKQANGCYQLEEDGDLKVPLSHLKLGISKKANRKRRCTNRNLFASPNKPVSIKVEVVLEPEVSPQLRTDLPEVPEPIAETSESEFSMSRNSDSSNCPSNIWMDSKPNSDTTTCSELSDVVDSEEKIHVSFAEEQQLCTLNQISNDQFEHVDPKYIYSASEALAEVNNQEDRCYTENSQKELFAPSRSTEIVATANDHSLGMHDCLRDCSDMDKSSGQSTNNVGIHIPEATIPNRTDSAGLHYADCMSGDGDNEVLLSNQEVCSVDDPVDKCILSCNLQTCSGSDNSLPFVDDINDKEQLTECCLTDAAASCLISGNCLDDENQPLKSSSICEEKDLRLTSPSQDASDQISASELSQPPERLLSTRKAISPCSQERLCLAMNSIELIDDLENYKCKEKLTFGNENSEGSCLADASTTKDTEGSALLKKVKVFIGPKQIAKRWKTEKRGSPSKGNLLKQSSPPKGNLEGPRLSRSLPQLNTGCTSITRCSESAIAFSQRQMHDMESLALKLMTELKSMKDMVEEKLLFEAYRTSSLKNDADEVKIAIKSATKVEETTRKWLSMMTRDCTRFCKIMKLSQNGAAVSKNTVHREGRKISFADEAGGMLCHVNYFEDPELTLESDSGKQEDLIL
ncbi:uncharacterized protein LOC107771414 [Nicotiana tabacum]|uniref:uncharacterized protein LOC107771414 n=1 Tax=Nicotiana tabacum TaxID=4097 RepID=UPI003F4EBD70